jgi:hypothetical protein
MVKRMGELGWWRNAAILARIHAWRALFSWPMAQWAVSSSLWWAMRWRRAIWLVIAVGAGLSLGAAVADALAGRWLGAAVHFLVTLPLVLLAAGLLDLIFLWAQPKVGD